ncbi:MAG: ubiquinone/menaquinone biosynthesis methyltransferase [Chloroflexi bacterium]|nr:ubiquinone/menaquinone biosynthesis methyltransferase [Chloroflexota bacterium]
MTGPEVEAKRRYVAHLFKDIARGYDRMNTVMTGGRHHAWRRLAAHKATEGLSGIALDVATGTGDLALALARQPGIETVVGLDLVGGMLVLAQAKVGRTGCRDRVDLVMGDALALPFPDATFACVASGFSLRNVPDLRGSLDEMVRVLRPGGRLVSLEIVPVEGRLLGPLLRCSFRRLVPLAGALLVRDRASYAYLPRSVDRFPPAVRLADLFRELGLLDVGYRRLGLGMVAIHWGIKP